MLHSHQGKTFAKRENRWITNNSCFCLCYENIFENMVFTQTISSGLMIFFLLFKLLLDCELVLLWEIRKSINLESANFKLDPELNPLNDHTLIPCRTINNFHFFILLRDLTSLKKVKTPKWIERRVREWGRKRRKRKWECQPSHNGATIKEKKGRPPRIKVWG